MADRDAEAEFGSRGARVPPDHRREGRNPPDRGIGFHEIQYLAICCLGRLQSTRSGPAHGVRRFLSEVGV